MLVILYESYTQEWRIHNLCQGNPIQAFLEVLLYSITLLEPVEGYRTIVNCNPIYMKNHLLWETEIINNSL